MNLHLGISVPVEDIFTTDSPLSVGSKVTYHTRIIGRQGIVTIEKSTRLIFLKINSIFLVEQSTCWLKNRLDFFFGVENRLNVCR